MITMQVVPYVLTGTFWLAAVMGVVNIPRSYLIDDDDGEAPAWQETLKTAMVTLAAAGIGVVILMSATARYAEGSWLLWVIPWATAA